ncbi:MAG: ribonuclease P protein component [Clostridia bacterium]|jgi:ribonuclease P protein component|nr:ribonuclease P protein component [Clostridia bacterium]MBQ1374986.1 ribonuclease P protein component [Clostridia bacterium]MBQ1435211.1 ribonuclease P protein component [Clostridia bacterium]
MRIVKLKSNYEFKRAYKKGTPLVGRFIIIYVFKNKKDYNRLGITVSRKLGCAVKRNRVRRLISESYRLSMGAHRQGYDFVIVGRTRALTAKMDDVLLCMNELLKKNGLLTA